MKVKVKVLNSRVWDDFWFTFVSRVCTNRFQGCSCKLIISFQACTLSLHSYSSVSKYFWRPICRTSSAKVGAAVAVKVDFAS